MSALGQKRTFTTGAHARCFRAVSRRGVRVWLPIPTAPCRSFSRSTCLNKDRDDRFDFVENFRQRRCPINVVRKDHIDVSI